MEIEEDEQWVCPSFNTYSSNTLLADIASQDNDHEGDFEFSLVRYDDLEAFGDEATHLLEGTFPLFSRDVFNNFENLEVDEIVGVSLEKLFIEERENQEAPSSSDEETEEELDKSCKTYCIWKSKGVDQSPNTCNKSKSTGFGSNRFRLRDLLRRSNSEGKDSFLFLTSKKNKEVKPEISDKNNNDDNNMPTKNSKGKTVIKEEKDEARSSYFWSPTRGKFNSQDNKMPRRRTSKGDQIPKRKTYLPYRQDLVGFFTSGNSFGRTRTFPPF